MSVHFFFFFYILPTIHCQLPQSYLYYLSTHLIASQKDRFAVFSSLYSILIARTRGAPSSRRRMEKRAV